MKHSWGQPIGPDRFEDMTWECSRCGLVLWMNKRHTNLDADEKTDRYTKDCDSFLVKDVMES